MQEPFDPRKASTWDEQQQAVYETGYREGEASSIADLTMRVDWDAVLTAAYARHRSLGDAPGKHARGPLGDMAPAECCGICLEAAVLEVASR